MAFIKTQSEDTVNLFDEGGFGIPSTSQGGKHDDFNTGDWDNGLSLGDGQEPHLKKPKLESSNGHSPADLEVNGKDDIHHAVLFPPLASSSFYQDPSLDQGSLLIGQNQGSSMIGPESKAGGPLFGSAAGDELKQEPEEDEWEEVAPGGVEPDGLDVAIRNVVTNFNARVHIDLRKLGMTLCHVYYDRSKGVLSKQIREPKCFVKIFSSGKVSIVGCTSEDQGERASRYVARLIQRVFPRARFSDYRVSNILATCRLPFGVRIETVNEDYPRETQYEPELNVGLIWRSQEPKATLRIYTTGSITVTGATSTEGVQTVLTRVYPILAKYQGAATNEEKEKPKAKKVKREIPDEEDEFFYVDDDESDIDL